MTFVKIRFEKTLAFSFRHFFSYLTMGLKTIFALDCFFALKEIKPNKASVERNWNNESFMCQTKTRQGIKYTRNLSFER
jgi:hypothetical protein